MNLLTIILIFTEIIVILSGIIYILIKDKKSLKKEITQLIQDREYLYLHFPDGHKFQYSQSFLNRVRVEVDYYLKIINYLPSL